MKEFSVLLYIFWHMVAFYMGVGSEKALGELR